MVECAPEVAASFDEHGKQRKSLGQIQALSIA
jgi:hypothetical protein